MFWILGRVGKKIVWQPLLPVFCLPVLWIKAIKSGLRKATSASRIVTKYWKSETNYSPLLARFSPPCYFLHFSAMAMRNSFWNFFEWLTNLLFPVHVVKNPSNIVSSIRYRHSPFSIYLVQFYSSKQCDLISLLVSPIQKAVCSLF